MPATDLTLTTRVSAWVYGNQQSSGMPNPPQDSNLIGQLITQASAAILSKTQRAAFLKHVVTEVRSGIGSQLLMLKEFPVLSMNSLSINDTPLSPKVGSTPGYFLEPWDNSTPGRNQSLLLAGYQFSRGVGNITVSYNAGYAVSGEAQTVPNDGKWQITPSQVYGRFARDEGVSYASGTPLTLIASGVPTVGQYVAAKYDANSIAYQFAQADEGAGVLLNYSFIPGDLDYACMKWVGEWLKYRSRIGQRSSAQPGGAGTNTWIIEEAPADVKGIIQAYMRTIPIGV